MVANPMAWNNRNVLFQVLEPRILKWRCGLVCMPLETLRRIGLIHCQLPVARLQWILASIHSPSFPWTCRKHPNITTCSLHYLFCRIRWHPQVVGDWHVYLTAATMNIEIMVLCISNVVFLLLAALLGMNSLLRTLLFCFWKVSCSVVVPARSFEL